MSDAYVTTLRDVVDEYERRLAESRSWLEEQLLALVGRDRAAPPTEQSPAGETDVAIGLAASSTTPPAASTGTVVPMAANGTCPRCDQFVFGLDAHIPTCTGEPKYSGDRRGFVRCPNCDRLLHRMGLGRHLAKHRTEQPERDPAAAAVGVATGSDGQPAPAPRRRSAAGDRNPRSAAPLELPPRVDQAVGE